MRVHDADIHDGTHRRHLPENNSGLYIGYKHILPYTGRVVNRGMFAISQIIVMILGKTRNNVRKFYLIRTFGNTNVRNFFGCGLPVNKVEHHRRRTQRRYAATKKPRPPEGRRHIKMFCDKSNPAKRNFLLAGNLLWYMYYCSFVPRDIT